MNLVAHILKNGKNTPETVWKLIWEELTQRIKSLNQPLGHGTRTDKLESILKNGLDQTFANTTTHPEFTGRSFCFALDTKDGLTGAQVFSLMLDFPAGFTSSLVIRADIEMKESFIDRYAQLNPNYASPQAHAHLESACNHYCQVHGDPNGVPLMLIFDGQNEIEANRSVPQTPSEAHLFSVLTKDYLKGILVPANAVAEIMSTFDLDVPIYPMELLELADLAGLTGSHYSS